MSKKVVIIGAGVGGLATANILAKKGYDVHVYEQHNMVGGRMGLIETRGFRFDTGPSWYLMPEVFEQYFGLFGKKPSDFYELVRLSPAYKVFYDYADPIIVTGNLKKDTATFEALESGSGQKLQQYIASAERTYTLALRYFLYNPFRSFRWVMRFEVLRQLPTLLIRLLQPLHRYVQKFVVTKQLQQILEYPMVFLGASPWNAPSLYQLMSYLDFKQGVFYPRGGMYEVAKSLESLGQELGVIYHLGVPVEKILTKNNQAAGVLVAGKPIDADIVISNADLQFTETKLLDADACSYPESYWQKRTAGPSSLLLYLGVRGALPELEHHNLFFVDAWQENFKAIYDDKKWPESASMYVCKPSATDPTVAPKGHENVFVLVPLPAGVSLSKKDKDTYAEHYTDQFIKMSGVVDLSERIVVREVRDPDYFGEQFQAWQNTALGMSHTLKQSALFRPGVISKKITNLYYVGAGTQPGIGVPMCLIGAELVYKAINNDVSPGPLSSLEDD